MKKKLLVLVLSAVMAVGMMSGCGAKSDTSDTKAKTAESSSAKEEETEEQTECELEDGTYTAEFKTDSGMFHVNEANDGKGTLTVKDGKMTIHVSLVSKKIVNLFEGTSEDAQKDGAELLEPIATVQQKKFMDLIFRFLNWIKNLMWLCSEKKESGMIIR